MGLSKSVSDLLKEKEHLDHDTYEIQEQEEVSEDTNLKIENELLLLGIIWNAIRPLEKYEKLKTRYYLNDNLVIEKGNNSFWIYGKEDLIAESIKLFIDYFAKDIRDFKFIRPESEYNTFIYYFFKEAVMCRFNVLISNTQHEKDLQQVIIRDVVKELKKETNLMDDVNKKYNKQMIDNWISEILLKNTHLSM
ncbi:TPA: hypothetical protein ACMEXA_005633 [Klebsiella variicola subsp. variicola]|uniref:hypothetical protein n=1 Tax=Klebsiella variicola TaxID=244366 RepID=UPI001CD0184C|nr:hypothetical protein [Klebsiella variicola]HBQ8857489.1 hypothetical protein [Klebsiella variicola subsp. variicola]HBQ8869330.1 hypothetical protein [Klebsiella pneumoniae]MEC5999709.1 hypothetical protein [Klebsiella variicola]UBN00585.1 hypothetical protein LB484_29420 [Klebsiella variicola]HBQ8863797.1 hypothetical protein [Klebsiella variicola subsp. variicola]